MIDVDQNSCLSAKGFEASSHVFSFLNYFFFSDTRRYAIPYILAPKMSVRYKFT